MEENITVLKYQLYRLMLDVWHKSYTHLLRFKNLIFVQKYHELFNTHKYGCIVSCNEYV